MLKVTLRPATQRDFDYLYQLVCVTMKDYVTATTGWDEAKEKEIFTKYFDFSTYQISVIVLDGHDIGYLKIERTDSEIFLANIHLNPVLQNQGIGSSIIRSITEDARGQGIPVSLKVLKVNHPAVRLYERLGFRVREVAEDYFLMQIDPSPRNPATVVQQVTDSTHQSG